MSLLGHQHASAENTSLIEVELKFAVSDLDSMLTQLLSFGAQPEPIEDHADTYYRHPCRDFVETGEALRIRRVNGVAHITYKGARLPGDVKMRHELEWCLAPGDAHGAHTESLWELLGFEAVATVKKRRRPYRWNHQGTDCTVTIDEVEGVGSYVEIERVVSIAQAEVAKAEVLSRAHLLGLKEPEKRSYLGLLLDLRRDDEQL